MLDAAADASAEELVLCATALDLKLHFFSKDKETSAANRKRAADLCNPVLLLCLKSFTHLFLNDKHSAHYREEKVMNCYLLCQVKNRV